MTDDDTKLLASLTGYTPGPWTGWNMIHADTGIPMTPDEIGEMVKNNVLQSIKDGGSAERFMFVSGETPFGPADMCHVGNGPKCLRNTALIAAAPDLHRIATELAAENKRLRAVKALRLHATGDMTMTDKINTGGPAYPVPIDHWESGMTLRDYFAGQAIGQIISVCANDTHIAGESAPDAFARKSYEIADAMITAREVTE